MAFDGFFISRLILETKNLIKYARLEKVTTNGDDKFLFSFYINKTKYPLLIDLNPKTYSFHFTDKQFEKKQTQFQITLKKHLDNAILVDIVQHRTDRTIIFEFENFDLLAGKVTLRLIFEAMGKHCNLFLVKDSLIIDCHKKMFNENGRSLLPKANFEFFESDKLDFTQIDYTKIASASDLVNNYLGISPLLANYLFEHRISLSDIKTNPTKNVENNRFYCFNIFETKNIQFYDTLSSLLDDTEAIKKDILKLENAFINKQIDKHLKKKEILTLSLDDSIKDLHYKDIADTIYSSSLDLNSYSDEINGYPLDITKTLNKNAQSFYKKYQKAKRSIIHLKEQLRQNEELLNCFLTFNEEILFNDADSLSNFKNELTRFGFKTNQKKVNKKSAKEISIKKIIFFDSTIYIGKNSLENEYLIHKIADKSDYWFHVKDSAGSHVVIKTNNLNEDKIRLAAMLAAYYSKMRFSSSVPIDYTQIKNLKKIPKKPLYQVAYSSFKTIYIDVDENTIKKHIV